MRQYLRWRSVPLALLGMEAACPADAPGELGGPERGQHLKNLLRLPEAVCTRLRKVIPGVTLDRAVS